MDREVVGCRKRCMGGCTVATSKRCCYTGPRLYRSSDDYGSSSDEEYCVSPDLEEEDEEEKTRTRARQPNEPKGNGKGRRGHEDVSVKKHKSSAKNKRLDKSSTAILIVVSVISYIIIYRISIYDNIANNI